MLEKISTEERIRTEMLATIASFGEQILHTSSRDIFNIVWDMNFKKLFPNEKERLLQQSDEIMDDFLNVVNLETIQKDLEIENLRKFTERGIKLLPAYDSGASICKKELINQYATSDIEKIKSYRSKGFNLFRFAPKDYNLLVVDIDVGHSNNVNGFDEFYKNLAKKGIGKLRLPDVLRNLNNGSYPCYTSTPSGGIHLYFSYTGEDIKKQNLCENVEVFHANSRITAPGSRKNGKSYVWHGDLNKIRRFPDVLRDLLKKEIAPKQEYVQHRASEEKKYTLDDISDYVLRDNGDLGNNVFCFRYALRARKEGYSQNEIIDFLKSNGKTCNHAQIKTTVISAFRYER